MRKEPNNTSAAVMSEGTNVCQGMYNQLEVKSEPSMLAVRDMKKVRGSQACICTRC